MIWIAITLYILGLCLCHIIASEASSEYKKWMLLTGTFLWPFVALAVALGIIVGFIRDYLKIDSHYGNFRFVYWGYKNRNGLPPNWDNETKIGWAKNHAAMLPFVRKKFIKLVKEGKI